MDKKQQVIVIHGGTTFNDPKEYDAFLDSFVVNLDRLRYRKDWKDVLQENLGEGFDVLQPRMPNKTNAQYADWEKIFKKIMEKVDDSLVLVGHSLGALFLVKYLSENTLEKNVPSVHLVAAPFDDEEQESLGSFKIDTNKVENIQALTNNIFLYFSTDDPVIPVSESQKYAEKLPQATLKKFTDKGHFNQEAFPELVHDIQNIS